MLTSSNSISSKTEENYLYILLYSYVFLTNIYPFYQDFVNKEVFYSVDGLWKVKPEYHF